MTSYIERVVDAELDLLVDHLPAVSLEGAKGVGKTATALRRAVTVYRLDNEEGREIVSAEPTRLTSGDPPILIDEWQRLALSLPRPAFSPFMRIRMMLKSRLRGRWGC